jgi:HNH endonuclease
MASLANETRCAICGGARDLDIHHVTPRRMGGSHHPDVLDESNQVVLCRRCHTAIHEGRWRLERSSDRLRVRNAHSGEQIMRRFANPGIDVPDLFELLNLSADSLQHLENAVKFLDDEALVEAFAYARNFGKHAWLVQAAILHEAQARSIYGEETLIAVARRFEISLRQAEKYAAVWETFFASEDGETKNVNVDVIALQEPSWYIVAASETNDPHAWLAYAQDRKLGDPRYSVSALRRDIRAARLQGSIHDAREAIGLVEEEDPNQWRCPWIRLFCTRSGRPVVTAECLTCEVRVRGSDPDAVTNGEEP